VRIKPDQLQPTLERDGLAPIYLLSGDEPLQITEGGDTLRSYAARQGYTERTVLHVEPGFAWGSLHQQAHNRSLFGSHHLIELRLAQIRLGKEGANALIDYAYKPPADNVLVIKMARLDPRALQSKWFKALDATGIVIQVWPIEAVALPQWIIRRMATKGIKTSLDAAKLIADHVEGNLLAASQELELLQLLNSSGHIGVQEVSAAISDSSRFDLFELADSALGGDATRTLRVLRALQREGVEPLLVNWALTRELRKLCQVARQLETGKPIDRVMAEFRLLRKRAILVRKTLSRHGLTDLRALLLAAGRIDRIIKGAARGNAWDELTRLSLRLSGTARI
jgi:DNA polymerase-3 subunit delta